MKYFKHYRVEYKLVSGGGINRGELGSMTNQRAYSEDELGDAINFVNKYKCYECENIYSTSDEEPRSFSRSDYEEGQLYHLSNPKIWEITLRGDWRSFKDRDENGKNPLSWKEWTHHDGDTYEIKSEFFDIETRYIKLSCHSYDSLKSAFKDIYSIFKDEKNLLLSDWTLYSKKHYIP